MALALKGLEKKRDCHKCPDRGCLRFAPDKFLLTKPNPLQHPREAGVATLRWCSGSSWNAVRLPSEQAFSFAGIPTACSSIGT